MILITPAQTHFCYDGNAARRLVVMSPALHFAFRKSHKKCHAHSIADTANPSKHFATMIRRITGSFTDAPFCTLDLPLHILKTFFVDSRINQMLDRYQIRMHDTKTQRS
jgi:hypothetical protein